MPTFYDIQTDECREATQHDVDSMVRCVGAFGLLAMYLRQSDSATDQEAVAAAVSAAQGTVGLSEIAMRLRVLRLRGNREGG